MGGIHTVVTTANSMTSALARNRRGSLSSVDVLGNGNLIRPAQASGAEGFVFVSAAGLSDRMVLLSPFLEARRQTEETLHASRLRPVLVPPGLFQETWTSACRCDRPCRRPASACGEGLMAEGHVPSS